MMERTFKQRRAFEERMNDVVQIRKQHPNKIPVIIEKYHREKSLPVLDKTKFLVPDHVTMSELVRIISLIGGTMMKPYKETHTFEERVEESKRIRREHPDKYPVIIEKYREEKNLPIIDKRKFLVPGDMAMCQLIQMTRSRMHLTPSQALYFLANQKTVVNGSSTIGLVYQEERDPDGYLYFTYVSQETFG